MGLSVGIVGLPNVGKSTIFNALTGAQNAEVANYPFCTIKPNRAIVAVPDGRVEKLQQIVGVPNAIHATIEFVDIAGLVKGASKGEGLGNQFLGNIRDTDVIVHVIRCFEDPNVVHVSGNIDPVQDIEIVNLELVLADLQQLERKIDRLSRQVKGDKKFQKVLEMALSLQFHLHEGKAISIYPDRDQEAFIALNYEMRFLTGKPVIFAANVGEESLSGENFSVTEIRRIAADLGADVVVLCGQLEEEVSDLLEDEQRELLELAGVSESGLSQVIKKSYAALRLISFFTKNENEVRAWTIPVETTASKAAGVIHTDFERGFIRAEVISFNEYSQFGNDSAAKAAGAIRLEGKNYIVQDGDIILFRFNV